MTDRSRHLDVSRASGALLIEHCDIPAEMTIAQWRKAAAAERRAARAGRAGLGARMRRALRRG